MITDTAQYDLMGAPLTKFGVCEAICQWIAGGGEVEQDATDRAIGHEGETHYVVKPRIDDVNYYIKIGIADLDGPRECLVLISAHPPRRG